MAPALIAIAQQVGAPLLLNVLGRKIGRQNAALVEDVLSAVAMRAGVNVNELDVFAEREPEVMREAIRDVETAQLPELIALAEAEMIRSYELQVAEMTKGPLFAWLWRPLWMYGLFLLWVWHTVGLHVVNAIYKIAIPAMDLSILLGLTTLFLGLYMGGHTIKEAVKKWKP